MRSYSTLSTFVKIALLGGFSLMLASKAPANAQNVIDKALPVEQKKFVPAFPGNDTINFAAAYGDRSSGQHGTFGKFPGNFETPPHVHSHDYRAVVLSGEMTNPFKGETNPPLLKPGSFWSVKAGSVHTTACVSDTPCEFFMFSQKSFDFKPTE